MWVSFSEKEAGLFLCAAGNKPLSLPKIKAMDTQVVLSEIQMRRLALHRLGNKSRDEGMKVASKLLPLPQAEQKEQLQNFFLGSFKFEEFYQFNHPSELEMNEIFSYCKSIFEQADAETFYEQSVLMLQQLYNCSNHPKIKGGEFYLVYFEDILVNDELVEAIGIFKTENKEQFLKLRLDEEEDWTFYFEEGVDLKKMDKGCLVFNVESESGFRVASVDLKSSEAKYWRDEFLQITQLQDELFYTQTYLKMCKDFGKQQFEAEEKQEQVAFLNKSLEYFETQDSFDAEEFVEQIFEDNEEKKEQFNSYKQQYQEKVGLEDIEEEPFFIATPAVKKAARSFKRVIQLDSQMEIKVQSAQAQEDGLLQRGFDEEKGMYYYKLYFNEEK